MDLDSHLREIYLADQRIKGAYTKSNELDESGVGGYWECLRSDLNLLTAVGRSALERVRIIPHIPKLIGQVVLERNSPDKDGG